MDQDSFLKLVERAEKDPAFLHKLTFQPESLVEELKDSVDRPTLGVLIGKQPGEIIAQR